MVWFLGIIVVLAVIIIAMYNGLVTSRKKVKPGVLLKHKCLSKLLDILSYMMYYIKKNLCSGGGYG